MKKIWIMLLVVILCFSCCGVALAKSPTLNVIDYNGDPINWIHFKLHHYNHLTKEVDTVVVSSLQDYEKDLLNAAAHEAYPDATINELGRIYMSGWDTQYEYVFDYFGPFTAKVNNPNVHKGDKVVLFVKYMFEDQPQQINAFCVKKGTFSFRCPAVDSMDAKYVYVILH